MVQIQLDGKPLVLEQSAARTLGDLVELVKTNIDPDTIITSLLLEGNSLAESDWFTPLVQQHGKRLDVTTGTRREFLADRLSMANEFLSAVMQKFSDVERLYSSGLNLAGNSALSAALKDLHSYVNWYNGILELDPKLRDTVVVEFNSEISELKLICDQLFQHQLYNAWQGVSETIKSRLIPQLEKFGRSCSRTSDMVNSPSYTQPS